MGFPRVYASGRPTVRYTRVSKVSRLPSRNETTDVASTREPTLLVVISLAGQPAVLGESTNVIFVWFSFALLSLSLSLKRRSRYYRSSLTALHATANDANSRCALLVRAPRSFARRSPIALLCLLLLPALTSLREKKGKGEGENGRTDSAVSTANP